MDELSGKTIVITGASRGIGRAIALNCAAHGANIVILAKTTVAHEKLPGTIYSVASEVKALGARSLAIPVDIYNVEILQAAVEKIYAHFSGIDALINNAGMLSLTNTAATTIKNFDLMMGINVRAVFFMSQLCFPFLKKSLNPHIINISPPLNLDKKWFKNHLAYTLSKYGMSMCTLGMAEEFKQYGVAVNSLWPKTTIATSAVSTHFPEYVYKGSRHPEIVADAVEHLLLTDSKKCSGNFFTDEDLLRVNGYTDFTKYAVDPKEPLCPDGFL